MRNANENAIGTHKIQRYREVLVHIAFAVKFVSRRGQGGKVIAKSI